MRPHHDHRKGQKKQGRRDAQVLQLHGQVPQKALHRTESLHLCRRFGKYDLRLHLREAFRPDGNQALRFKDPCGRNQRLQAENQIHRKRGETAPGHHAGWRLQRRPAYPCQPEGLTAEKGPSGPL